MTAPERKKQRHRLEGYQAIRAIAPNWLHALLSIQHCSDLMGLHRDQIDLEKNTIRILQDKTQKSQR
jgi:integrase